jgi:hypothetical protein
MIGPLGSPGEESFDIFVCTPDWLTKNHSQNEVVLGLHHLVVFNYDIKALTKFIRGFIAHCEGDSWADLAAQLSRLGRWEFDGYRDASGS